MNFILDADCTDVALLGGKARALAELAQSNIAIPDWFVLSPQAFEYSLTETQRALFHQGEMTTALDTLQLSATVEAELQRAIAQLCPHQEPVAVRSSALEEDGRGYSFAGQLSSYLSVYPQDIVENVVNVWKSAFSDRLLTYCREHDLPLPGAPAVLVQRMINADVAGVAFSANPVTGQRGIAVISAVAGLGESLVSGAVDADTYHVDRTGTLIHQQPATSNQQPSLLSNTQLQAIAHLARQTEQHFGRPQDIEWAIADETLYLLQSRPITTIARMPDPDGSLTIWDNSNIAESYGGITTPLTFSFARRAYEEVYREFCRLMGVSEEAIAQHSATFRCMIGLMYGRIYYNLLNWYRVLALLPGFTVNRHFMEQMMGVREELPADVVASLASANFSDKFRDATRLAKTLLGLLKNQFTLPRQISRFYQRLDRALSLSPAALSTLRPDELAAHYADLERQLLTRWDAPLVNDFFAMIFYGVLRKLTAQWCGDTDATLQNDLISGAGGMISAEPAQRLRHLAQLAAHHPEFADQLRHAPLPKILRHLDSLPTFQQAYQDYLDKFGDRCLEELKLESATLHDDPLLLLRSIGNLATTSRLPTPDSPLPSLRETAEARVAQSLKGHPLRKFIFQWVLTNARNRVRDRENLRFERTRVFGRVRRIFLELGKRFSALDLLHSPRDIFYLTVDEILGTIDGTTTSTDLKGLVTLRQTEFQRYTQIPPPPGRFQTHSPVHPISPVYHPDTSAAPPSSFILHPSSLQGTGCCPGIVRAPVQVITDPKRAQLQPGSILVAERTDPGWILLFPAAAGILVERGSLLSHAAIVAREMGIPAIVSIPDLIRSLKDGDWVEMDGSTGRVAIVPPPTVPGTVHPSVHLNEV